MNRKKFSTNSGLPLNRDRSSGFWVATPDRAGVEVADPHHDAAGHHQWRGGEAEFLGAEQRRDDDVAGGAHAAVALHGDPVAQPVEHQRLLGVGEADLPRGSGVLERRQRRRTGAAVIPGDQHDVGVRLRHPCRDGADADRADQLDVDAGVGVGVLQVVDQLRQVLDRVDVVVRRRRNQTRRPASNAGSSRCSDTPCSPEAAHPHPVWRPAPS